MCAHLCYKMIDYVQSYVWLIDYVQGYIWLSKDPSGVSQFVLFQFEKVVWSRTAKIQCVPLIETSDMIVHDLSAKLCYKPGKIYAI